MTYTMRITKLQSDEMCILDVCCAVYFVNYFSALQEAGEAHVKRDLDYSKFSERTPRQL